MSNDKLTKRWVVASLAAGCCVLWGSAIPMIKTGYRLMNIESYDAASQVLVAGLRFTLAGILVLLFESVRNKQITLPKRDVTRMAAILCLAQTVGQYFFFYIGVANSTGVNGAIILGSGTFIAIITSCLIMRLEKMSIRKFVGCVLGFSGVLLINLAGGRLGQSFTLTGEGFVLISQICYAISTMMINRFSKKASPVILSGTQFFIGGLILSAAGLLLGGRITGMNGLALVILVYLALVSAVAYTVWSILLAHNPVSDVAIYGFVNPVCSVLLSAVILGEYAQAFRKESLLALGLVCVGIFVVNAKTKS